MVRKKVRFLKSPFGSGGWNRPNFHSFLSEERNCVLFFTAWLSEVLPFSTKSVVVMMVKMLYWKLSHRSVSLLRSYKPKFPSPMETTLLPQSASTSPTADIFLVSGPHFWIGRMGLTILQAFWGCPMVTSAEYIQSFPHQFLSSLPWLSRVFYW